MDTTNPIAPNAVDFLLDPSTGDLALVNGEATYAAGLTAIAQGCRVRLGLWRREWFWNPAEGLPAVEAILNRGVPLADLESVFKRALLAVPGVVGVTSLSVTLDNINRTLSVQFVADTNNGLLRSSDFGPFIVTV